MQFLGETIIISICLILIIPLTIMSKSEHDKRINSCSGWHSGEILSPLGILIQGKDQVLICNDNPNIIKYY